MNAAKKSRIGRGNHVRAGLASAMWCPECKRAGVKVRRAWDAEADCNRVTGVRCGHTWLARIEQSK